jgi:hypothetical protein
MDRLRPGTNGTPADAASSALPLEIAPNTTWLLVDPRNNAIAPVTLAVTRVEGSWIRCTIQNGDEGWINPAGTGLLWILKS